MKVLRTTLWKPDLTARPVIVTEADLEATIEDAAEHARAFPNDMFVTTDIFEIESDDPITVTIEAGRRSHLFGPDEKNMALLYYFEANELAKLTPNGRLEMDQATPLTREQVVRTLQALVLHSNYKSQTVVAIAKDGTYITLSNGEIQ